MQELPTAIPDVDGLLLLQPEELGAKLLFLVRQRGANGILNMNMFHPQSMISELWTNHGGALKYPREREDQINMALIEAWAWIEAQGLIVPALGMNGQNGFRVLSRRARAFENEQDFAAYAIARQLPRDALHASIRENVWLAYMRGDYDVAVFLATKAVEVAVKLAVREEPGFEKLMGTDLMRRAFHPENGPLADMTAHHAERQARSELFSGTIGSYKNPQSHRDVNLEDPVEAMEVIMLANHLLRVVAVRLAAIVS
ncbi:TIGR02391 family protein [Devosia beringensis]|uniref:TIGR02391 family protein n=1 Tax=Devosia beringensis TaxID=2657486 RepID=UPI00186B8404|nr:TIGR02391 family protein [Devosia beringensis]